MSDRTTPGAGDDEPSTEQIIAVLFQAAMSGDETAWANAHDVDPKLLQMWRFTHAQEYIGYLENVLRSIRRRAGA
ncbi:MAG: hypothetical protein ABSB70_00640 [Candidatus Velthaea sp.]|jgi:hypothetical protein